MSSTDAQCLKALRKNLRTQITRNYHTIQAQVDSLTSKQKQTYILKFQKFQDEISELNHNIANALWAANQDADELEKELDDNVIYDDRIINAKVLLEDSTVLAGNVAGAVTPADPTNLRSRLKLPEAPLPTFSGSGKERLDQFLRNFENITSKYALSEYELFILLRKQVSDRALLLIDSLETSKQSFKHAKDLLTEAFASPVKQKFDVIKRLSNLKLNYDTDPYYFISEMRIVIDDFTNLNINAADVMQYFILSGMNDTFKNQLINVTQCTKPSLQDIRKHIMDTAERYEEITKKFKERKAKNETHKYSKSKQNVASTSNFAAAVNSFKPESQRIERECVLCTNLQGKDAKHPLARCPNFESPKSKVERLQSIGACLKCAFCNHKTENCRFKFKNSCFHCKEFHFSFLCLHGEKPKEKPNSNSKPESSKPKPEKAKEVKETNSGVVWMEALHSVNSGDSILPTFSCMIGNSHEIRSLKDSGCQRNFVTVSLVGALGIKVKETIQITVNGFNSSKCYNAKLVDLPLHLGDRSYTIEAITVPSIPTKLHLKGLEGVAKFFEQKGFKLADKHLTKGGDCIQGLDLILGTEASHCFEESAVNFGNPLPSTYLDTHFGVMLLGNIDNLKSNLKSLPTLSSPSSASTSFLALSGESNLQMSQTYTKSSLDNDNDGPPEGCTEGGLVTELGYSVISDSGVVNEKLLNQATEEILNANLYNTLKYDEEIFPETTIETNDKLIKFTLENTKRNEQGRLIMPLMWNGKIAHLLGDNLYLSKQILKSNLKKLQNDKIKLKMIDDVFKDQEAQGIIRKIENLPQFITEYPKHSFLPHMPVFKMNRDTTKCRVVFLSNLKESKPNQYTVSHNQAMLSGPNLNRKMTTALLSLRFDSKLLCFDLKKAVLQIELNIIDQARLLFLWFRNISQDDFSTIAYISQRLPFGLRNSPATLMIAMYKILMLDVENDSHEVLNLKKQVYSLMYMDNGACTANDSEFLYWAFERLPEIFGPYQFELQQFVTNDLPLQQRIDEGLEEKTPERVKLFGISWDRLCDTLSTQPIQLNPKACTKRLILKSIAKNFDLYNFNGPLLNRARLFMHNLQCNKTLGWDTRLPNESLKLWKSIAHQVNSKPVPEFPRFVGQRDHKYKLVAFTDNSKFIYGAVIYIVNLTNNTVNFILAKNRIVNKQLETKSTPALEFHAMAFGAEVLIDTYNELTGIDCVIPIDITGLELHSDSLVSLNWLNSYVNDFDKMRKRTVFIMNRLTHILKICEGNPVKFSFVSGFENPADCITRPLSPYLLSKSNYSTGPSFLTDPNQSDLSKADLLEVTVPNVLTKSCDIVSETLQINAFTTSISDQEDEVQEYMSVLSKCSEFRRLVNIYRHVFKCIKFVTKGKKFENKFAHIQSIRNEDLYVKACNYVLRLDQKIHFESVFDYFEKSPKNVKDIPLLVKQLNIYLDKNGLLRVRSKFDPSKSYSSRDCYFPILISKHSELTSKIILDIHEKLSHAGCYTILSELRKKFWITHYYSIVKKVLRTCVHCKRHTNRTIKLNQNVYREFRSNPPRDPFSYIFIDYFGHYWVNSQGKRMKVWILCICCLYTRAVNLQICYDMTTQSFLRALQIHIFQFGLFEKCFSDMGSQLVAGGNVISDHLKDAQTQVYFQEQGIKSLEFSHYYKGCHELGGLVESLVKLNRDLINGSIRKLVLDIRDFEFVIAQTIHIVNRRPIAFKEALRDNALENIPEIITPENLVHCRTLKSINVIPELQPVPDDNDPDWTPGNKPIQDRFSKLNTVRNRMIKNYNKEFVAKLIQQAVDSKDRYKPVKHEALQPGDIVLFKEDLTKPSDYPMAIVRQVVTNSRNEVTGVTLFKGKTKEVVKRHVSSVIPLLTKGEVPESASK